MGVTKTDVDPCSTLVILGASGDLTHRLLLPGLGTLLRARPELQVSLVGAAQDDRTQAQWSSLVKKALTEGGASAARADKCVSTTRYVQMDVTDPNQMQELLDGLDHNHPVILYFALPPAISQRACEVLSTLALPTQLRLAIEKPFGSDLATAQQFNQLLARLVPESQIFRVDHYLGKATVLNTLGLRFNNRLLEPTWNAANIERVEIISDEELALEGRAGYYDHAGALRDMLQSHLLLVMSFVAMEQPARIDALELRDLIVHTLRATRLWQDDPKKASRRARYEAGSIMGKKIKAYVDEPGVDPERMTETLAEVTLEIANSRWAGVPFRLRSGKALGDGFHGIVVKYRPVAHSPEGFQGTPEQNVLVLGLAPETLQLSLTTNGEGDPWDLETSTLSAQLSESPLRPYGEILEGILNGDPLLSVRGDMAEQCWRIMGPVLQAWADDEVPMDTYPAGSTGPKSWR